MPKSCECLTETQKWVIGIYTALLFLLIASPFMYRITNKLTGLVGWESSNDGCPNIGGLLLHAVVFLLLVRVLMALPLPGKKKHNH